jgi:hypothetical protein
MATNIVPRDTQMFLFGALFALCLANDDSLASPKPPTVSGWSKLPAELKVSPVDLHETCTDF